MLRSQCSGCKASVSVAGWTVAPVRFYCQKCIKQINREWIDKIRLKARDAAERLKDEKCYCEEVGFYRLHDVNPCARCMSLANMRDFVQTKFATIIGQFEDVDSAFEFLVKYQMTDNVLCVDASRDIVFSIGTSIRTPSFH
jgi:hypothetical protein